MTHDAAARDPDHHERERLLRMLAAATFIIFFQAYMVAPIIPALSSAFGTSVQTVGLVVPAYLIPYGVAPGIAHRCSRARRVPSISAAAEGTITRES